MCVCIRIYVYMYMYLRYIWMYGYITFLGENKSIIFNSYGDRLVTTLSFLIDCQNIRRQNENFLFTE